MWPSWSKFIVFHFIIVVQVLQTTAQVPTVINVEIDWMDAPGGHSHMPQPAEIAAVVQMFACHNIVLNVDLSNQVPHVDTISWGGSGPKSFQAIKSANMNHTGGGWHYCLFAHRYSENPNSSGRANFSNDFAVTLGAFTGQVGTPFDRAATFVHELGHNLGLSHCGIMESNCEETGSGPVNLASIMSYAFQLHGVRTGLICLGLTPEEANIFKEIDYSGGRMCSLNEDALVENFGTGMKKVDWNCDGTISGTIAHDLDSAYVHGDWCNSSGSKQMLNDFNEWANIRDVTDMPLSELNKDFYQKTFTCLTYEEYLSFRDNLSQCQQPVLVTEECTTGKPIYLSPGFYPVCFGTCTFPFYSLGQANSSIFVPPNSVLYLKDGIYNELGIPVTLTKKMVITSIGTAIIDPNYSKK